MPLEVLRQFADGRTSFVLRQGGRDAVLAIDSAWVGSELVLARFAEGTDATVVQRLASGRIRIFHGSRVYSYEDGVWLPRLTAATYHQILQPHVDASQAATANAIVDLCVHSLSPARIGATIVWYPKGAPDDTEGVKSAALDLSTAFKPPVLRLTDPSQGAAVVHALGQLDRAAIVNADGRVLLLNVTLQHGGNDGRRFEGGTRHNSAGHFSAHDPAAVVFVVSADGPVTVFSQGAVIASFPVDVDMHDTAAERYRA